MKFLIFIFIYLLFFAGTAGAFQDIPADHWAKGAVEELAEEGVVRGFSDDTFRGKEELNRYEMAVWLTRLETTILKRMAIHEKLAREFAAEISEIGRELKSLKILTKD